MQAAVLVLIAALAGVNGICDEETVQDITQHWNGSPPTDIMAAIGGQLTLLTFPEFTSKYIGTANSSSEIKCGQTIIGSDGLSVASFIYFRNSDTPVVRSYEVSEVEPGVLIFKEFDTSEGFGGLSARNVNSHTIENDEEFQKEVADGFTALSAVKVKPGSAIGTECDSCSEKSDA